MTAAPGRPRAGPINVSLRGRGNESVCPSDASSRSSAIYNSEEAGAV